MISYFWTLNSPKVVKYGIKKNLNFYPIYHLCCTSCERFEGVCREVDFESALWIWIFGSMFSMDCKQDVKFVLSTNHRFAFV